MTLETLVSKIDTATGIDHRTSVRHVFAHVVSKRIAIPPAAYVIRALCPKIWKTGPRPARGPV